MSPCKRLESICKGYSVPIALGDVVKMCEGVWLKIIATVGYEWLEGSLWSGREVTTSRL